VKRFWLGALTAAGILSISSSPHEGVIAEQMLQLQVSPSVSMAPAQVRVRAIIERDAENRALEIVADGAAFYRRTVLDLDGAQAPKVNELWLLSIPGGEYEVTATLYDSKGVRTIMHRTLMVMSNN
jgi:hypothetical protein